MHATHVRTPDGRNVAAVDRIAELEVALQECAAPFRFGTQSGIEWESIAREFNRRQGVAADALGLPRGADFQKTPR